MHRSRLRATALIAASVAAAPTTIWAAGNAADQELFYDRGVVKRPLDLSGTYRYVGGQANPGSSLAGGPEGVGAVWQGGGGGQDSFIVFAAPSALPGTDPQGFEIWSDNANWSSGAFPTGGGIATIGRPGLVADTERLGDNVIFLDVDISLSELNLTNSRGVDIQPTLVANPVRNITTAVGGLTIRPSNYFPEPIAAGFQNPGYVFFGQTLQANLIGSGPVVVDGSGGLISPLILAGNNTFGGGLTITGGAIVTMAELGSSVADPAGQPVVNELALGSGSVVFNGGTLRGFSGLTVPTFANPQFSKEFRVGAGGGTVQFGASTGPTFNGVISGAGAFNQSTRGYGGTYQYSAANTHTGEININTGTMLLNGSGAFASSGTLNNYGGVIRLDAGSNNRLNDAGVVRSVAGDIRVANTEAVGTLVTGGYTAVTYTSTAATTALTTALARENGGVIFLRGTNIGGTGPKFNVTNSSTLAVGGGGAINTTSQSIIPFVFGLQSNSVTANTQTGGGSASFAAVDAGGSLRPLKLSDLGTATAEYASSFGAASDNVNINASVAVGNVTANALRIGSPTNSATGAAPTISAGAITVTSGAVLNTVQSSVISSGLTAGANELLLIAASDNVAPPASVLPATITNGLNISGVISGTGGLTKVGPAHLHLSGANTYTGTTRFNQGRVFIAQNIPSNKPGDTGANPFGLSTSAVELVSAAANVSGGGSNATRLINESGTAVRFGRDLKIVSSGGSSSPQVGGFNAASSTEFYGNIELTSPQTPLLTVGGSLVTYSGQITGPGALQDAGSPGQRTRIFSALGNTFTGGIQANVAAAANTALLSVTYEAGGVTPFGTGPVYSSGGTFRAIKDTAGTVNTVADAAVVLPNTFVVDPTEGTTNQDDLRFDGNLSITGGIDFGAVGGVSRPTIVPASGNLSIPGVLSNGSFRKLAQNVAFNFTAPVAGSNTFSSGTMTISGNNSMDSRIFVGIRGFVADAAPTFDVPGGLLVLASNNALGEAGVQVESNGSAVGLSGNISTASGRNAFLRTSSGYLNGSGTGSGTASLSDLTGVVASGALFSLSGANTFGGNVNLITSSSIGADAGATLTVGGFLADYTGQGPTPTTGGAFTVAASSATLTKVGTGTVAVRALSDTNIFNLTGDDVDGNDGTVTLVAPGVSSLASVQVSAGTLRVTSGALNNDPAKVSAVRNLAVLAGTTLDLSNQALAVDYTGISPLDGLEDLITSGRGAGAWNGTGITSSSAAAAAPGKFAIGIGEVGDTGFGSDFFGVPIDGTTVLLRYTLTGDANLSGNVTLDDFTTLAAFFGLPSQRWATGDFNYDGLVNLDDFTALASNFGLSAVDLPRSSVPEPTAFGAIGLAMAGLAARRRRA
ncbi:MAG: hypothetical protein SGI86_19555 [Deltaproteobacteria bacterium]|nr:hypothetical protein [Deltaproteobacteria bacterium]